MHLVLQPLAVVASSISPGVLPVSSDIVVLEGPCVAGSILPLEVSLTVLHPVDVTTCVLGFVRPSLYAAPMLLVVLPIAFVDRAICELLSPLALCLVIDPFALIKVSIGVDEAPDAMGFTVKPLSFVECSIELDLSAFAATLHAVLIPLANVDSAVGKPEGTHVNEVRHFVLNRKVGDLERALRIVHCFDFSLFEQNLLC